MSPRADTRPELGHESGEIREAIQAIGCLAPDDPMYTASLALALASLSRRLDRLYAELGL